MADARDETTWMVLELTSRGDQAAEEGDLESLLRKQASLDHAHPVFIPVATFFHQGSRTVFTAMEGYAFVASGVDYNTQTKLGNNPYVKRILSRGRGVRRVVETVPDSKVQEIRQELARLIGIEIHEGARVRISDGPLRGITGKVLELTDADAAVLIEMRSIRTIRTIPRFLLHPVDEDEPVLV